MWQFLHKKQYILQSGDGSDLDDKECLPEINDYECTDGCLPEIKHWECPEQCLPEFKDCECREQSEALIVPDKETFFLKPPQKSQICLAKQQNLWAGLWIFNKILLRAWCKQRERNEELREILEHNNITVSKKEKQLHIYKTLFRIEQKRNAKHEKKLKLAVENVKDVRLTCESLTTALVSLQADHSLMEQELESKNRELEYRNVLLDQTRVDLLNCKYEEQKLRSVIAAEQRNKKVLKKLVNEVCELGDEKRKLEKYCKELEKKCTAFEEAIEQIAKLEARKSELIAELDAAKENMRNTEQLERENRALRSKLVLLQQRIDSSLAVRCTHYWEMFKRHNKNAVLLIISATILLLPAMPSQQTLPTMLKY